MIIRESDKLDVASLPTGQLSGKHLMQHPYDDMGFGVYLVTIEAGQEFTLKGTYHKTPVEEIFYSHGYYCLEGIITATSMTSKNSTLGPYVLREQSFHMFPHSVSLTCNSEKKTVLLVFYVPQVNGNPSENVISATHKDITASSRCVDWGKGTSLRFLIEEDGYPISITHCSYDNGVTTKLEYDEFLKTNIFIAGSVEVQYGHVGLEKSCKLSCDNSCVAMVSANENDRHSLSTSGNCRAINVFSPALKGPEKHSWSSPEDYSDFQIE